MRKALFAACMLAAGAGLAPDIAAAADKDTFNVGVANLRFWGPGRDFSNVGSQTYYNSFDTLIGKNPNKSEIEWEPMLATSWQRINDSVMELKIRQDVKFHNGDPLTVRDIEFSLESMINPRYFPRRTVSNEFFGNMYRVEAVDDETVRIYTKKPEPLFEILLNTQQSSILPRKYLMELTGSPDLDEDGDYDRFTQVPVGSGPYKIAEYTDGEELVYERFDDFWGEPAPFQRVRIARYPELSSRITALANGEVDLITNVPPDQLAVIDRNPKLKTEGMVTPLFHVMIFNQGRNGDKMTKQLRKALSMCVNRDLLNQALWDGKAVVPDTHTYPQFGPYYQPDLKTFEYNPDESKRIIRENNLEGTTVRFDTDPVYYTNGLLAAQAIGEMWADCGIKQTLNVNQRWTGDDPDMEVRNWSNPMYFPDPAGSFGIMWSPTGNRVNPGRDGKAMWVHEPGYTELWEKFRFEPDVKKRNAAYAEIMDYVKEEAMLLVLYQPYESYGMRKEVSWAPFPGHIPYVLDFRAGRIQVGG